MSTLPAPWAFRTSYQVRLTSFPTQDSAGCPDRGHKRVGESGPQVVDLISPGGGPDSKYLTAMSGSGRSSGLGAVLHLNPSSLFLPTTPVPPTIEQRAGDTGTLVSKTGELVTMMCPVRGSPPIHVSWLKDGLPLPLSQRTFLHSSGRTLR